MTRSLLGLTLTLALATVSVLVYATEDRAGAGALDGELLFRAKGCASCHQRGDLGQFQIGPNLTGLAGWADTRVEGLDAEAYVRQSIEDPSAYVVFQYQGLEMPTISLTGAELASLVRFLLETEPGS